MTTLADVRDRVRKDLHDTDGAAYRWSDAQLDRHIDHALSELSLAIPRERTATLATTDGSRELALGGLTDLIEVTAVEYPADAFPPAYVGFATWAGTLTLHTPFVPDGSDATVHYHARHTLDGSGTSLSAEQVDLLVTGASAYAALEQSVFATDLVTTGADVAERYATWGRARHTAFRQLLQQYGWRNRVRARRMYVPA